MPSTTFFVLLGLQSFERIRKLSFRLSKSSQAFLDFPEVSFKIAFLLSLESSFLILTQYSSGSMLRAFLLCIPYSSKSSFYFNRLCAKGPLNVMKRVFPVLSYFSPIQNALNIFSFLRFSVQYFLIFF